jgi:outer membrane protein OmpA-like peptidoglycan-associated protein
MSQSVARLRELLFDNEAQALGDLAKRIDSLADVDTRARDDLARRIDGLADIDARGREELRRKIDEVYARAGNTERMTASVSEVINEALRRAEVSTHSELTQTIAPLVVTTIKTELRNSQDEMVEALYPITGRLVKAYVASAMKDLSDQMNRRLEQNPLMLRLQSLTTGRSVGDLALAGTQDFDVKELFLIRRGSGELVAHWPDTPVSGRDHAMSGVLAAVNEFANEAFSADQTSLRQIDIGNEEVYLRGSPIYLLAARCSGRAAKSIEQTLDDAFLSAVETQQAIDARPASAADATKAKMAALASVGESLKGEVAHQLEDLRRPAGTGALKSIAALIVLPLLGWMAWGWYNDYRIAGMNSVAKSIVAADPAMQGYPIDVAISEGGNSLTISGLTPSQQAKSRIVADLKRSLPDVALEDRLSAVAGNGVPVPDVRPELTRVREDMATTVSEISRSALVRTHGRAEWRLKQAAADLDRAASTATDKSQSDVLKLNAAETSAIISEMKPLSAAIGSLPNAAKDAKAAAAFGALSVRLQSHGDSLIRAAGGDAGSQPTGKSATPQLAGAQSLEASVEQLAAECERIAALAATVSIAKSLRPVTTTAVAAPVVAQAPQISPQDRLANWARSHAIFFASNLDYRNTDSAARYIDELAKLMKATPALVRIVGYTDEAGGQNRNSALALDRAEKIRRDLIALGIQPSQIITVGRTGANELSDARGASSPNRRVEFEIGFEGEAQQ